MVRTVGMGDGERPITLCDTLVMHKDAFVHSAHPFGHATDSQSLSQRTRQGPLRFGKEAVMTQRMPRECE